MYDYIDTLDLITISITEASFLVQFLGQSICLAVDVDNHMITDDLNKMCITSHDA